MTNIKIAIVNESTVLSDADVRKALPDLQTQIHRDFAPAWGIDADLQFIDPGQKIPNGAWVVGIFDTSDQANALGYHDVTNDGLPVGKVFAKSDLDAHLSWTVTASHELLEMLADPDINLTVFTLNEFNSARLIAYEVCDPCEADADGYKIGHTLVSDFVFPSWFETFRAPGTQFDFQKLIKKPLELRPGGYISFNDISSGVAWQQIEERAGESAVPLRPRVGSRRERRRTSRTLWYRSTATRRNRE